MAKRKAVEEEVPESISEFDHEMFEATLKKSFGDEVIQAFSSERQTIPSIPSSSETLNRATGNGGIPQARITEISGEESGGKTTLALDYAVHAQQMFPNRPVVYVDAENAIDIGYARQLGLDTDPKRFKLTQVMVAEDALQIVMLAAQSNASLVIVDSVPSLVLRKDLEENSSTEQRVGGVAKAMHSHLRKITPVLRKTGCTVIYINQVTSKIGVTFGSSETTTAGRGLKYYSSIRLDVRRHWQNGILTSTKDGEPYGIKVLAKVVKNKVAPPLKKAEYDIIFGQGIDRLGGLVDAAIEAGVLQKSGAWIKLGGKSYSGKNGMKSAMEEDPALEEAVLEALKVVE